MWVAAEARRQQDEARYIFVQTAHLAVRVRARVLRARAALGKLLMQDDVSGMGAVQCDAVRDCKGLCLLLNRWLARGQARPSQCATTCWLPTWRERGPAQRSAARIACGLGDLP